VIVKNKCAVLTALLAAFSSSAAAPAAPERLVVLSYNLNNYGNPKVKRNKAGYAAVAANIAAINPDIMMLSEMSGEAGVDRLLADLAKDGLQYGFKTVVEASDSERKLAMIARFEPVQISHDTSSEYQLKGKTIPVRRGFAHCHFRFANGYELHVVGAHLKSKVYNNLGQTDMRRYEARHLRYLVDGIIKANAAANVLVVGDLNDSPNSSPINTLMKRRSGAGKRLYDLRPLDEQKASWTHLWRGADEYSRHDYALATFGLLPEIDFVRSRIAGDEIWQQASDHRPVVVAIKPNDRKNPDVLLRFKRSIYNAALIVEEKALGSSEPRQD
jgi:endonuclease/exonuclease/phosphatase family metal-dependent hydrolase